ncbi:OmpA family protein [Lelliottia amnigena]|uniref:OmpA family protein n=1 Tax=Lelliottia amnigena TaxID=61646 RepID=UPI0021DA0696|nr:OmpA family protein [Lelliottia amnigena]MCU7782096.1 OmpA family protein [Lelliottia amnigena]
MFKFNRYLLFILLTVSFLLALGIYISPVWNKVFLALSMIFIILIIHSFRQKKLTSTVVPSQPTIEKQVYLVIGPYVNQWFTVQRETFLQHPETAAIWLPAATSEQLRGQLLSFKNREGCHRIILYFPIFPDGHDTSALLANSLYSWQKILTSSILSDPLDCVFAVYIRCSGERSSYDPDRAIWINTLLSNQDIKEAFNESAAQLAEKMKSHPSLYTQHYLMLNLLWQWMEEEQLLQIINTIFNRRTLSLHQFVLADYGTGFNRHGAWSRWLDEKFTVLPALAKSRINPPLPAYPASIQLPVYSAPLLHSRKPPASATVAIIIALMIASSMIFSRYNEEQRLHTVIQTLNQLQTLQDDNVSDIFTVLDTLNIYRKTLKICSLNLSFQNWGFSHCKILLENVDKQLEKYAHWIIFTSANSHSLFASGSAAILPEREHLLSPLISLIEKNPNINFLIIGHTDNSGSEKKNQKLSEQRAQAVRNWIVLKTHAAVNRFSLKGEGDTSPLISNTSSEGKEMNRRIEIRPLHPTPHNVNEKIL